MTGGWGPFGVWLSFLLHDALGRYGIRLYSHAGGQTVPGTGGSYGVIFLHRSGVVDRVPVLKVPVFADLTTWELAP